ncbi:MAG: TolC family protein [Terracidiphilus sp.]|jgi:outer membrane protein
MLKQNLILLFAVMYCAPLATAAQQTAVLPSAPLATVDAQMQADSQAAPGNRIEETLTRQQAEQLALKNNPRISVAALIALAQKQVVRETRSAEFPNLSGNGTAVAAVEASRIGAGELSASRLLNHVGAGLQLSQLITDFGRTPNLVAGSSLQARAAEQSAEATREDIVLAADLAFYNALEAQATLQVAISTVDQRKSVSDQVDALTASKLRSTLDQSFAQVNLSQARLLVLDARNQADAAMASLNDILGTAADRHYRLVDDPVPPPSVASSAEEGIALALQQRPDLRALQLNHQADLRFSRAQHEQYLPTVSAQGIAGITPVGSSTYFSSNRYGAAGVNVSIPIFNGFKFSAEAAEADLRAKASDEQSRQLVDRIAREVRTAWLAANTAQQRMSVAAELLKEANTALDLAQTRYRLGLSSIVELSEAQLQQTQAQIADANALFEYEADLATLRFQSGSEP